MKKVLLIMLMAVTSMMASADVGEWSLGGQFVFGTEGSMPGVGLKFQSNYSHAWRSAVSGNYYFKKNGVSCFDLILPVSVPLSGKWMTSMPTWVMSTSRSMVTAK